MREPFEAPAPGDPRSAGPRPRPRGKDLAWGALGVGVVGITTWQLVRLGYVAATDPDVAPSGGLLVLAFLITVVWLLTVYWVAAGAWRRTVWGCPFEHAHDAPRLRRCPRHGLVPGPHAATTPSTSSDPDRGRGDGADDTGPP